MSVADVSHRPSDAVIVDMDGGPVDSEPTHVEAMREVLPPFAIPYTDADNERYFGFTDPEVFRDLNARHALELDEVALTRRRASGWRSPLRRRRRSSTGSRSIVSANKGG